MALSNPITWANLCAEFSLNPTTAVFPADFYGKGGAPASGVLGFQDFVGRSGGALWSPMPGTYSSSDANGQGAGDSFTITHPSGAVTWTYGAITGLGTMSLASGGSGISITFSLAAGAGTSTRNSSVAISSGGNTWNISLSASGQGSGTTCVTTDTLVLMAGGAEKRAGDLVPGDVVYTQHEITGEWMNCEVQAISFDYKPVYARKDYPNATRRHRFGYKLFGKVRWFRAGWFGRYERIAKVAKISVYGARTYMARHPSSDKWRLSHNIKP